MMPDGLPRCDWAWSDPLSLRYHDEEWGVPVTEDRRLFEFLVLEGAQAGLSWRTVLAKRDAYRKAFFGFDIDRVAQFIPADVDRLLNNPGLIRNRAKLASAVHNAQCAVELAATNRSLREHLWDLAGNASLINRWERASDVPSQTARSLAMSRDLKRRGFQFVGPTICYAFMQATGMVQDHLVGCFRHAALSPSKGSEALQWSVEKFQGQTEVP